jgi:hypothetical protein
VKENRVGKVYPEYLPVPTLFHRGMPV